MIVACPGCSARYQIEADRLRPEGVRLRCTRCEAVFRVSPPPAANERADEVSAASTPAVSAPQPQAPREPAPTLSPPMSRQAPPESTSQPVDRERAILVADPEIEQGKATASALAQWGFQPALVHDGVEAILAIQRMLPRAIVIDAALPKMFGFQICEIVKRNESLRDIHVVLVGAIHNRTRYRRAPEEIYGADAYIERQELPGSLRPILAEFGMLPSAPRSAQPSAAAAPPGIAPAAMPAPGIAPAPAVAPTPPVEPPPTVTVTPTAMAPPLAPAVDPISEAEAAAAPDRVESVARSGPSGAPQAPEVAGSRPDVAASPPVVSAGDPVADEKIEQAERLARIVVSDIVLYSKEKFDAAVRAGNVVEAMQAEIAEGRSLFTARIDPAIQEKRDFLTEELLRVAAARGKP